MRGVLVCLVVFTSIARAQPLDGALARGRAIATGGPASLIAITLDAPPTKDTLAALDRYSALATFFVRVEAWDDAGVEGVKRVDGQLGVLVERSRGIAGVLARAARAGHRIGTFRARGGRAAALLAGLTEVPSGVSITRANAVAQVRALARGGVIVSVAPDALAPMLDELERVNCERRASEQPPITPVSLHYFVRDRGRARSIPEDVALRTASYGDRLADRCEDRAAPRKQNNAPQRPRGDFAPCEENPLAKGCQ